MSMIVGDRLEAGLRYTSDSEPGLQRVADGEHWLYTDARGRTLSDPTTLARIKALAIPPAWADVWICPLANGHLQATGRDARGRKQYRYHARWRACRDADKFQRLISFAEAQPRIRRRVARDLAARGLPRHKVLAAAVQLLDMTRMRIGNDEYARLNGSFGLTTLRNRHVKVRGACIAFRFRGKAGRVHTIQVIDKRLARIVKRCRELPGQELFQYLDENQQTQSIGSADVNAYLMEITGSDYSAKDFRTWGGTLHAATLLRESPPPTSETDARQRLRIVVDEVATLLGNTPAICRKCYIHPAVMTAFMGGNLHQWSAASPRATTAGDARGGLSRDELAVVRLLKRAARSR